jgi:putative PEP-CTERM system TPR-repeat lipoprotein
MLPEARWLLATTALALGDGQLAEKEADRAVALGVESASAQIVKVRALALQGDADRVLVESNTILEKNTTTDHASILAARGMAFLQKDQLDKAADSFDRALELDPESLAAFVGLARYHLAKNEYKPARDWIKRAIATDATNPDAWSVLGDLELEEGNLESAVSAFSQAIDKRDFVTLDRAKRALANVQLKNFVEADKEIQELRASKSQIHPYIHYVAGRSFVEQEQLEESIPEFEAVMAVRPNAETAMYLAIAHHLTGNTEQARNYTQQVLSALPRSLGARRLMGRLSVDQSDYGEAKKLLVSTLQGKQEDSATLYILASLALQTGDAEDALEYAQTMKSYYPDSSAANGILNVAQLLSGEQLNIKHRVNMGGTGSDAASMQAEIISVMAALRDKQYERALQVSLKLREEHPRSVAPLNLLSAVYVAMGKGPQAKEAMEMALEIDPHDPSAAINLAKIQTQLGNFQRALALLQELVGARPDNVSAAIELSRVYAKTGSDAESLAVLKQSLQHNPEVMELLGEYVQVLFKTKKYSDLVSATNNLELQHFKQRPDILEYRARAQFLLEDFASARRSFEALVGLLPNSAKAHYYLGDVIAASGDHYGALEQMRKASELDADFFPARLSTARLLSETGQLDLARTEVEKLRDTYGEHAEILGLSGWLWLQDGNPVAAEKELAEAQARLPDTALTLYLSKALWEQKKYQEGFDVMLSWLKRYPQDVAVLLNLGNAYLSVGMEEDANKVYEAILKILPDNLVALNNLAWLSRTKPEGLEYAERAYAIAPNDPNVLDTLGMIVLERGDTARSLNLLGRAAERNPDDLSIQLNWGKALLAGDKLDEAAKVLEVIASSDSVFAKDAMALLQTMPVRETEE